MKPSGEFGMVEPPPERRRRTGLAGSCEKVRAEGLACEMPATRRSRMGCVWRARREELSGAAVDPGERQEQLRPPEPPILPDPTPVEPAAPVMDDEDDAQGGVDTRGCSGTRGGARCASCVVRTAPRFLLCRS